MESGKNEIQRRNDALIAREERAAREIAQASFGRYPTEKGVQFNGERVNLDELEAALLPIISTAGQYRGSVLPGEDVAFMAQEVARRLRKSYANMHLPEFREACEKGCDGEFGEVFGINAATLMSWVHAYVDGGYHAAYLAMLRREWEVTDAKKQLTQRAATRTEDENWRDIERNFRQYRRAVYEAKQARGEAAGPLTALLGIFRARPGQKRQCGDPLWDYDGTPYAGDRVRRLNAAGIPGETLKDCFDWLIMNGHKSIFDVIDKI